MLASLNKLRLSDYAGEIGVSDTGELWSGLRESMAVNKDLCREQLWSRGPGSSGPGISNPPQDNQTSILEPKL